MDARLFREILDRVLGRRGAICRIGIGRLWGFVVVVVVGLGLGLGVVVGSAIVVVGAR